MRHGADVSSLDDEGKKPVDCLPGEELSRRHEWEEILGVASVPKDCLK